MKALLVSVMLSAIPAAAMAGGGFAAGFGNALPGAEAQSVELQRLRLCNDSMSRYLAGGPPPPSACAAPSSADFSPPLYTPPAAPTRCMWIGTVWQCR